MKKLTLILLTVILTIVATVLLSEASTVYYYLPYLHSNADKVTYCVVSNMSSELLNTTFTVGANSTGTATGTANSLSTLAIKTTQFLALSEQTVTFGSASVTLSTDVADKTSTSYAGTLTFTSAATGTTGTKATCLSVLMACFQGNSNPKRNLVGYACKDDSTEGPGGNNNVLGY